MDAIHVSLNQDLTLRCSVLICLWRLEELALHHQPAPEVWRACDTARYSLHQTSDVVNLIYLWMYIYIYVYMYICVYICIYIYIYSRETWIGAVSCFLVEWWTCRHCMDDLGIILAFQITFIVLSRLDFDYCCVFFYFRERSMGNTCKAITHSNALYPGGLLQSTPMLPPTPHNISLCWRACGMNSVLDNSRSKGYQSPPPLTCLKHWHVWVFSTWVLADTCNTNVNESLSDFPDLFVIV